jgi:hypothetical protein
MLRRNQEVLKSMLNHAMTEQINVGALDRILAKYEPSPNTFLRLREPYQVR